MRRLLLPLLLVATLPACRRDEPAPTPAPQVAAADAPEPAASADANTKPGTLRLDGADVPVTLERFDDARSPFTTYIPKGDFNADVVPSGEAFAVVFQSAVDGEPGARPSATFVFPTRPASVDSLRAAFFTRAGAAGWSINEDGGATPCLWASEGYTFTSETAGLDVVCFGEHAGRAFQYTTRSSPQTSYAFKARLDVLLDELRWRDTGAGLGAGGLASGD